MNLQLVGQLLEIPSADPEDARRRRLLNIMLVGIGTLTLLALMAAVGASLLNRIAEQDVILIYLSSFGMLGGVVLLHVINRYWSGELASSLFLVLLTVALALTDEPQEVVNGRSLFTFAIPILMASVLLRPYASFVLAGLVSLLISGIAVSASIVPNTFAMLGFFALALVSWLAARSLEEALVELRAINKELDQRVEERTQDLSAALAREQAEASKNQAVLEGIADGVIVFDNEGKAIVANPAIAHLVEQDADEIVGSELKALMGDHVAGDSQEMILDLLRDREAGTPSVRFEWGEKTLSVRMAPVRTAPEHAIGTVAVFRDYTREAEVERMKSAFVSMISHDLRTPLGAVMGYVDMLQQGVYGTLAEQQRNVLERINANTRRLLYLVSNLLDQAQIEVGRLSLRVGPFDPRELLADMVSMMEILAQGKGLSLACHVADDVPDTLYGDRERLHQILVNLVNNAVKFTTQGEVRVRVFRADTDHWAVEVSDTGSGIPDPAQSLIFEPFRQVDESITREHSGVGLGLSIVKQLTHLMGGDIRLTSRVGQGSTFTVVLPFAPVREAHRD